MILARAVRRWLTGESPIPNLVLEWLQEPRVAPWPTSTPTEDQNEQDGR